MIVLCDHIWIGANSDCSCFAPSRSTSHLLQDYTGDHITPENFYAVLLGNKSAITGGSKKVINSKPKDHIFFYYSDHGGPGVLGAYLDFLRKGCCSVHFLHGTYITKQIFSHAKLAISVCWRLHQGFEKEACFQ